MEKLKVLLIAVLIWAAIIWFARTMKQKSDERLKKLRKECRKWNRLQKKSENIYVKI